MLNFVVTTEQSIAEYFSRFKEKIISYLLKNKRKKCLL